MELIVDIINYYIMCKLLKKSSMGIIIVFFFWEIFKGRNSIFRNQIFLFWSLTSENEEITYLLMTQYFVKN